ncbi:MAG: hypothetical protein RP166_6370 [Rapeseed phyllody phytoplasma]|uniref:Uncharacterized protein n=2 Tax=16SrI (Aster yellows group) TaxID=3042590 RepID=A0A859IAH3_9MOLU|nr:MAG: hypothetical protein RP166_6370 [Rapeseed phyllody phytoplasma]
MKKKSKLQKNKVENEVSVFQTQGTLTEGGNTFPTAVTTTKKDVVVTKEVVTVTKNGVKTTTTTEPPLNKVTVQTFGADGITVVKTEVVETQVEGAKTTVTTKVDNEVTKVETKETDKPTVTLVKADEVQAAFKEFTQELLDHTPTLFFEQSDSLYVTNKFGEMSGVTNLDKNKLATQLATVSKFQDAVNTLGATFDKATVKEKLIQLLKNNDVNSDVLGILNDFVNLDQFLTVVCESKADLFVQQTDKEAFVAKLKETLEKEAHFTKKLDDEVKEVALLHFFRQLLSLKLFFKTKN